MDIKMPGINGVEALRLISADSPEIPVVLISAYTTPAQTEEAKRQGAYTVLTKPIDIQILLSFFSLLRKEESILVVDDDPAFCRTIKDILQGKGYKVETKMDAANVLGHMERNYKLTVVLDLKLGNLLRSKSSLGSLKRSAKGRCRRSSGSRLMIVKISEDRKGTNRSSSSLMKNNISL